MTNSYKIAVLKYLYTLLYKEQIRWHHGLCSLIGGNFNDFQRQWLLNYITKNRPKGAQIGCYWWKTGVVGPRKAFVKNLIKNLQDKKND